MLRFMIRRLLWAVFLFIAVTLVTYVIFFLAPANPERIICGGERARTECLEQAREELALDRPIIVQYGKFLERLVIHRDLGKSYITEQSVNTIVADAAPVTASLVFGGAILWMMIGLPIGILSACVHVALRPRRNDLRPDRRLRASGLDRSDLLVLLRREARLTPITGYCDAFNPPRGWAVEGSSTGPTT